MTDAAVADGRVLLLDGMQSVAWAVSATDTIRIGRAGDGPGEFRVPVAIAGAGGDTVIVADRRHRALQYFHLGDTAATWLEEVQLRFAPADLCVMHQAVYVLGAWQEKAMHRVDAGAGVVRSLVERSRAGEAQPKTPEEALRWHERTQGYLSCIPGRNTLVQVTELLGELAMYDTSGTTLWQVILPGFAQPVRTIRGDHVRIDIDPAFGYADRVASVALLNDDLLALTVTRSYGRESATPERDYRLTVRLSDGMVDSGGRWPLRTLAASGDTAVAYRELPYPRAEVWHLDASSAAPATRDGPQRFP